MKTSWHLYLASTHTTHSQTQPIHLCTVPTLHKEQEEKWGIKDCVTRVEDISHTSHTSAFHHSHIQEHVHMYSLLSLCLLRPLCPLWPLILERPVMGLSSTDRPRDWRISTEGNFQEFPGESCIEGQVKGLRNLWIRLQKQMSQNLPSSTSHMIVEVTERSHTGLMRNVRMYRKFSSNKPVEREILLLWVMSGMLPHSLLYKPNQSLSWWDTTMMSIRWHTPMSSPFMCVGRLSIRMCLLYVLMPSMSLDGLDIQVNEGIREQRKMNIIKETSTIQLKLHSI